MSIYITQQQKKEWEAEILTLSLKSVGLTFNLERENFLKELLSKAIVLPVEESWYLKANDLYDAANQGELVFSLEKDYPNGVIIKK